MTPPENAALAACDAYCSKHAACRLLNDQPVHYFDCERFNVTDYGTRQGKCDCTATADLNEVLGRRLHGGLPAERGGQLVTPPENAATSIREWQSRAAEWTDSRFPDDDLKQRGLVLGEETGEVLRCILKGEQDIRGGRDYWINGQLPKEAVDVFFCLAALAHRAGFDLADAIEAEWARIAAKDYIVKGALRD